MRNILYYVILPTTIVLAALGIYFLFSGSTIRSTNPIVKSETPARQKQDKTVVAPRDINWDKIDKNVLQEWTALMGDKKGPHEFHVDTKLRIGDVLVTEAYESTPGEYVISKIKSNIGSSTDLKVPLMFEVSTDTYDITGSRSTLSSRQMKGFLMNDKSIRSGIDVATNQGIYSVNIIARKDAKDPTIHQVEISGGFEKTQKTKGELVD